MDPEAADLRRQESEAANASKTETEEGEEGNEPIEYEKETVLYKRSDYLGQKKTIHLLYDVDMLIEATALHPDGTEEPLMRYELNGISKIMEKEVMKKETTTRPKLSLSFELSRSHLILLNSAKIAVDETVLEEIEPPKVEKEEEEKEDSKDEPAEGEDVERTQEEETTEADSEEEQKSDEADTEAESTEESTESEEVAVEKEYREKIVPHTFTVDDINETPIGARLLTKDQKKQARKRISALDQRDKDKQMADEAKNAYESLIYSMRDWLRDDDNQVYVDEADREALLQKLEDGEEWLYDEGSNVSHSKYQEKSYELTSE